MDHQPKFREYDLYVPLRSRDGKHLSASNLAKLKKRLFKQFGGLTYFPQTSKGFWKIGNATFRDDIIILRVLSKKNAKSFWKKLKKQLQQEWNQKEILIVIRKVAVLEEN
jgi:hypothetical protein